MAARGSLLRVLRDASLSDEEMLTQTKDVVQQRHMGRAQLHGIAESLGVSSADLDTVSNITERLVGESFARLAGKPGKCGEEIEIAGSKGGAILSLDENSENDNETLDTGMDTVSAYVEHGRTTPDTTQKKENQVSTAENSREKNHST